MNAICRNRTKRGRGHNEMILQLYWFTAARKKTATCLYRLLFDLEVPPGFGPGNEGFADLCLTTWLWHHKKWSGRRDSDSRPPPWQGGALPTELLPHKWCLGAESNHRHCDFQSHALPTELPRHMAMRKGLEPSTSSVTGWHSNQLNYRTILWWEQQGSNL